MGVSSKCKCACVGAGASLGLGFAILMIWGVTEKKRFEPFYREAECPENSLALPMPLFSLPPNMVPPGTPSGTPPFGLYGSVLNTTSTCRNPNQAKLSIKKDSFVSTLYLPEMSSWTWGASEKSLSAGKVNGSYLHVAAISLKGDYVVPADGVGSVQSESIASAPLTYFLGVFQAALLTGYVPLYTKTAANIETCVKLFGMEMCDKKEIITWCGVLGGNCLTQMSMAGAQMWVPGLCAYTKTICRSGENGEAEMKALVTAENLGVTTMNSSCMAHTGLPPIMNCPIPVAPGINATTHQVKIDGFVDGPHPDSEDLDKAESMVVLFTGLWIAISALGSLCSFGLAAWVAFHSKSARAKNPTPAGLHEKPTILNTQPEQPDKQQSTAV